MHMRLREQRCMIARNFTNLQTLDQSAPSQRGVDQKHCGTIAGAKQGRRSGKRPRRVVSGRQRQTFSDVPKTHRQDVGGRYSAGESKAAQCRVKTELNLPQAAPGYSAQGTPPLDQIVDLLATAHPRQVVQVKLDSAAEQRARIAKVGR